MASVAVRRASTPGLSRPLFRKQSGGGRLFGRVERPLGDGQQRVARSILEIALDKFLTELQPWTRCGGRRINDLGQPLYGHVRGLPPGNGKAVVKSDERKDAFLIEAIGLNDETSRFLDPALPLGSWSARGQLRQCRAFPHQSRCIF